jgi:LPS-assembly lipoprotein
MWLFDRRGFLLTGLSLVGCGFEPVHRSASKSYGFSNEVFVQAPKNRGEFELVRNLEIHFGPPAEKRYHLRYKLTVDEEIVDVSVAQELNRFNLVGLLEYSLVDVDGVVILSEAAKSFTGYSGTGTTVATERSKQDSYDRLMVILAKQVSNNLLILDRS